MIRQEDASEVNRIANSAPVRRMMFLGMRYPEHDLDFTSFVEVPTNVALIDDGFCGIFGWTSPGTYECHIMADPEARGGKGMASGKAMLDYMHDLGMVRVWGQPSVYNRAAICYIRRMGLKSCGFGSHPTVGDVEYFEKEL